jgi:hypothetical protein
MSKPSQKTLVTLTTLRPESEAQGSNLHVRVNLDLLIDRANQQYAEIKRGDQSNSLRGIFLGLLFWQIKNEAGHGKFMAVATERMPDIGQTTRSHYMKLAAVFVEKSRLALPERMNIPDAQLALHLGDASGIEQEMVRKAIDFVGQLSLHELMIKYEIRAVGLAGKLRDEADAENDVPLPPDEELRRRREQIFGETAEHVMRLHKTLTTADELQYLESSQLEMIDNQLIEIRAAIAIARKPSA